MDEAAATADMSMVFDDPDNDEEEQREEEGAKKEGEGAAVLARDSPSKR